MEPPKIRIRLADVDDWAAIWPIMRAVSEAGDTFTYPTDLTQEQAHALWMTAGRTVVAVDAANCVLGTAKMGANQMGPGSHVATGSFMVAPTARGSGVGRQLAQAVIDWAKATGFKAIQFNAVVSTNAAAVHLWQALGFKIVGTIPAAFAHPRDGYVALYVMHLAI